MILALTFLAACSPPCSEREGVYSLLDDNGLEWNLRLAPDNYQNGGGSYMGYTLGVQVPAYDNASAFVVGDLFNRKACRAEYVSLAAPLRDGTTVEGVHFNGEVSGQVDDQGNLFLDYTLLLSTPDGQQDLAAQVTVPRVSDVESWTGDTGDSWY